jgi:hypothetical protein
MTRYSVIPMLLLFSAPALAAPDYKYCELAGLAFGAKKELVGSVASRIADRQKLLGTPECVAVWSDAYTKGERMSVAEKLSPLDAIAWNKLQDFENSILDAVIGQLNIKE